MAPYEVHCIGRVTNLPLMKSALELASEGYGRIKNSSALVSGTLSRAEQSIYYVAETAKPMVNIFEKPISLADSIVCQGLDRLEEKVPVIKKSPEELKGAGLEKYEDWKKYGTDKVSELKDYGYHKVGDALENQYAKAILKSVDTAVGLTESAMNHYFPPSEDEPKPETEEGKMNVVQRLGSMKDKMRHRMYKKAITQLQGVQKRSMETLQRMNFTVDLIQYAKGMEETGRQKVSESVNVVQEKAKWLWEELNKDEPVPEKSDQPKEPKPLDQQLLSLGRRATKQAIVRYNELITMSKGLPAGVMKAIHMASSYATDVYNQLAKASSLRDVSSIALAQISAGAELIQKLLIGTVSPVITKRSKKAKKQKTK